MFQILLQPLADCLFQSQRAGGGGIAGLVVHNGGHARIFNIVGGGEVRLAGGETDDVHAVCLHFLIKGIQRQCGGCLYV